MAIYFMVSDCLNSVLKKKQSRVLMVESVFKTLMQQVVTACK